MRETARPFDTVYVSFYKGLGAISGAMLLGDAEFCSDARVWLRRMGGNLHSVLPYAISSWSCFRECCCRRRIDDADDADVASYDPGVFANRRRKLRRVLEHLRADATISSVVKFDPAVPEVSMVHGYLDVSRDECMAAVERAEAIVGIRVLSRVRGCIVRDQGGDDVDAGEDGTLSAGCRFEWTMGESNSSIEDADFVLGWRTFAMVLNGS